MKNSKWKLKKKNCITIVLSLLRSITHGLHRASVKYGKCYWFGEKDVNRWTAGKEKIYFWRKSELPFFNLTVKWIGWKRKGITLSRERRTNDSIVVACCCFVIITYQQRKSKRKKTSLIIIYTHFFLLNVAVRVLKKYIFTSARSKR